MASNYFRFNFKGKEGAKNNSFITIKHERPDYGEVTVGLSLKENGERRDQALENLSQLSYSLHKKVLRYSWNYYDAVLVETMGFDAGLGILFSSRLETQGMVPRGSTEKLKTNLRNEGHEFVENDINLFPEGINGTPPAPEKKKRLFRLFRIRKRSRGR